MPFETYSPMLETWKRPKTQSEKREIISLESRRIFSGPPRVILASYFVLDRFVQLILVGVRKKLDVR